MIYPLYGNIMYKKIKKEYKRIKILSKELVMRFLNYLNWQIKENNRGNIIIYFINREDADMSLFSMLKEVVVRIKSELEEER